MEVRELIRSWSDLRKLYLKFRPYCSNAGFTEPPLWNEEDLPKLQPFFDYSDLPLYTRGRMSDEVAESFEFYKKCEADYASARVEMRDSLQKFTRFDIAEALDVISLKSNKQYPYIIVGTIDCSFDRMGDKKMMALYEVHQSEFEKK